MSLASIATSVPVPIENPTSLVANAGASFIPSPTIPTFLPLFFKSNTLSDLSFGKHSAITWSILAFSAICFAVFSLSPVIIYTSILSSFNFETASCEDSFILSAIKIYP